jgi:hypothetical protein
MRNILPAQALTQRQRATRVVKSPKTGRPPPIMDLLGPREMMVYWNTLTGNITRRNMVSQRNWKLMMPMPVSLQAPL